MRGRDPTTRVAPDSAVA